MASDFPVILDPACKEVTNNIVPVLGIGQAMVDPPGNRSQWRPIPGGRVVPDREERLEIGRRRRGVGHDHTITPQAPPVVVVKSLVLATDFQVVLSTQAI